MIRNSWQARLLFCFALWIANIAHGGLVADVSNTPEGMLVYHGSAAMVDMLLLFCAPSLLSGRLCDDLQTLCLVSMVINFVGWLAYMNWVGPELYNWFILACGYTQWARLIYVGRNDTDSYWLGMVSGADSHRGKFHSYEEKT